MDRLPLSVTVITLNEEDNIGRCLDSVQWADEILVVDSGSEDRTRDIAESKGARVLHNDWPGMVAQKQFATDKAEHDWVFNIDADEWVDDELRDSIRDRFDENLDPTTAFEVTRKSRYLGQWIEHSSWYPDRIIRLFNKQTTDWGGDDPHAHVEPTDSVERLDGHLLHVPYDNLRDHLDFINDYTDTMAEKKHEKGSRGSVAKAITHSFFKFLKELILKRGFLDGRVGLISACMSSWYVFLKYAKLWEKQTVKNESTPES